MAKLRKCRLGKLCFLALKYLWLGGTFNRWEPELKISWYLQTKSWKEDRISQPLQSKSQSKFLLIKVGKMLKLHLVKVLVLYEPPLQGDFLGHLHPPRPLLKGNMKNKTKRNATLWRVEFCPSYSLHTVPCLGTNTMEITKVVREKADFLLQTNL